MSPTAERTLRVSRVLRTAPSGGVPLDLLGVPEPVRHAPAPPTRSDDGPPSATAAARGPDGQNLSDRDAGRRSRHRRAVRGRRRDQDRLLPERDVLAVDLDRADPRSRRQRDRQDAGEQGRQRGRRSHRPARERPTDKASQPAAERHPDEPVTTATSTPPTPTRPTTPSATIAHPDPERPDEIPPARRTRQQDAPARAPVPARVERGRGPRSRRSSTAGRTVLARPIATAPNTTVVATPATSPIPRTSRRTVGSIRIGRARGERRVEARGECQPPQHAEPATELADQAGLGHERERRGRSRCTRSL